MVADRRPLADAIDVFDLGRIHVLSGLAIMAGVTCERCCRYFVSLDAALAEPCQAAA